MLQEAASDRQLPVCHVALIAFSNKDMQKLQMVPMKWPFGGMAVIQLVAIIALAGIRGAVAEESAPPAAAAPTAPAMLPFRLEFGGYYSWLDSGFGDWRGLNAEIWWRGHTRFIPALLVDSQTRPTGTQQNYAFTSYMNWLPSFYSTQGISLAPQRSDSAIFFPKVRFDIRGHWKLLADRSLVLAAGFTHFDFGRPGQGQIYNAGTIYYRGRLVLEGNFYLNRSQPGGLWSASGSAAAQYGTEGRYWAGVLLGGGNELYRYDALTPVDIKQASFTTQFFYRRWLTPHVGYVVGATLQDKLDTYNRFGGWGRVFLEF